MNLRVCWLLFDLSSHMWVCVCVCGFVCTCVCAGDCVGEWTVECEKSLKVTVYLPVLNKFNAKVCLCHI